MKMRITFLLLALIIVVKNETVIGGSCGDKGIFLNGHTLSGNTYSDIKLAYNGVASCASLNTDNETAICCYAKVKFKNKEADQKFTHRGCREVTAEEYASGVKNLVKDLEKGINAEDSNIQKVDVEIDCNSIYMKLTGIFLLSLCLLL